MQQRFWRNVSNHDMACGMAEPLTIILTRPMPQSQALAKRLNALGHRTELFPLLEIAELAPGTAPFGQLQQALSNLRRYAMAAFVSPNAIHAVLRGGLIWPRDVAIAVMGEGSRHTLAEYGIDDSNATIVSPTDPFRSDSETLLEQMDVTALRGKEVVIFRSETGRELLADALLAQGIAVDKVVCYQRLAPTLTSEHVQHLAELLTCSGVWLISSSEALRTLESQVQQVGGEPAVVKMHQAQLWVSHQRIAQNAQNSGFERVRLIGSGDENLLLALQSCP
jgi:uroporphyrinogen-III synthase